ncbi:hypothetical protein PAHAL_4G080100 [Panicum hallii]|uniref:Uncharacterized protein n=1 Tax=Panicum hallii TaxID=206008 RepID=A0A2S3HHW3_9POAL|nr:uncharacterized protein LOC112889064 [Panicum hallii]PAN23265.1 hypothetical protein PAHAL_4G080100 [Panicum hallii]PAN23266.1 hypothetical protein PAHAL_4G080100 [Panicum hallii]
MLLPSRRSTASPHHPCGRAPVCFLLNLQILPPRRRCTSTPLPPKLRIRAQRPGRTTWPDGGCGGHSGKLRQKQRQAHSSSRKAAAGSQQKQNDGDKQCKQHDAAGMSISISLRATSRGGGERRRRRDAGRRFVLRRATGAKRGRCLALRRDAGRRSAGDGGPRARFRRRAGLHRAAMPSCILPRGQVEDGNERRATPGLRFN